MRVPLRQIFCALAAGFVLALTSPAGGHTRDGSTRFSEKIIFDDAENFFRAISEAATSNTPQAILQARVVDAASPGFAYFDRTDRFTDAATLWKYVQKYGHYYEAVKLFYEETRAIADRFAQPYSFLHTLYPDRETPPAYFMIGHFQGGATAYEDAFVISLENWAADWHGFERILEPEEIVLNDPAEVLVPIVAHELVHYYQECTENCDSLLSQVMLEGVADFVAYRMTGARTNIYQLSTFAYYENNEAELWEKFREEMHGTDPGIWLYNNSLTDIPHNLGYAVGFHIAAAYYEQAEDKGQALKDLIHGKNARTILMESGYNPQ